MSEEPPERPPRREIVIPVENILIPLFFMLCLSVAYFILRVTVGRKLALWLFAPAGFFLPVLIVNIGNAIIGIAAALKRKD